MNGFFLLAVALTTQHAPQPRPVEPHICNLLFAEAQEEWVHDVIRPHRMSDVLPKRQAQLVKMLGARDQFARDFAAEELLEQGDGAAQALCWGRRATDPEIRDRCERLWWRLFICPGCKGVGTLHVEPGEMRFSYWDACTRCMGTGDLRYFRGADENGDEMWFERAVSLPRP